MDDQIANQGVPSGGDDHAAVQNMLNSEAWQARLDKARVEREKILAERALKSPPSNPFASGQPRHLTQLLQPKRAKPVLQNRWLFRMRGPMPSRPEIDAGL